MHIRTNYTARTRQGIMFCVLCCFVMCIVSTGTAQDFSRYHRYDELTEMLRTMAGKHKAIARLESIGTTREDRNIWLMEIANREGTPVEERPALFIGATFEGNHLIGSEIALYTIDYLLTQYDSDAEVRDALDNRVFYIFPRVNPDAAEMMFANVKTGRKTNTSPYDDDNDGRIDEDGPEDMNGDGFVTVMRVRDREGEYIIDPDEPRLMKKADPKEGEAGVFKLYREGIDNDGDGYINEDPPGGIDINRNFQHEYPYYTPDAGSHMVSERESRALMDWIIAHRNVAAILTFGESDNLIQAPGNRGRLNSSNLIDLFEFADESNADADRVGTFPAAASSLSRQSQPQQMLSRSGPVRQAVTTIDSTDVEYYKKISDRYVEITGIKTQPPVRTPRGAFFQYGYFQFGVPSFTTPGWGITGVESDSLNGREKNNNAEDMTGTEPKRETTDSLLLAWMDREGIDGFIEWTGCDHPEHGEVEIGGFKSFSVTNPPTGEIGTLGASHAKFAVYLSTLFAQVRIADTEITSHGGGIFHIKAEVENSGFLPTALVQGVTSRSVKPTMVQLDVDPKAVISGTGKTTFFQSLEGSGKRLEFEWVIKGTSGDVIELKVVSPKGGSDRRKLTLK